MLRSLAQTDLQTYLKDISRFPLLTAQEELVLARDIRKKLGAWNGLKPSRHGARLSKRALKAHDEYTAVRDRMIESNLRLVVSVAKHYTNRGLTLLDLIEEGNIGLLKAVERFDPRVGTRFSTYATYWIRQSVRRALVNTAQTVRIPVYMVELISKWKHAAVDLAGRLGREPSFDEIAEELDISPDKVGLIKRTVRSAAQTASGTGDAARALSDLASDEGAAAEDSTLFDEGERDKISRLLDGIDHREAQILKMRFGLDDDEPKTLSEIGKKLRITRERVRQIEGRTLRKLHRILTEGERDQRPRPPAPGRG